MEATASLFQGSGKSPEEIFAAAKEGKPSSMALPVAAKIKTVSKFRDLRSPNVVARVTGSGPKLRDEYVVYTEHLDHLGIGQPVNGDRIYNGALDNASGSACLLEIARAYSKMEARPRRSILFVSVTAGGRVTRLRLFCALPDCAQRPPYSEHQYRWQSCLALANRGRNRTGHRAFDSRHNCAKSRSAVEFGREP
jgi:hypothetical protein